MPCIHPDILCSLDSLITLISVISFDTPITSDLILPLMSIMSHVYLTTIFYCVGVTVAVLRLTYSLPSAHNMDLT